MDKSPKIEFLVSSEEIKLIDIPEFLIGLKITNQGDDLLSFDISKSELFVNDESSIAWDLAVQNGTIVNLKIKPHRSETIQWDLGDALFETPGTYDLKLVWEDFVQRQTITVLNE